MKTSFFSLLSRTSGKYLIINLLFILNAAYIYSQGNRVTGKVSDKNTGQPVSYASIALFEKAGSKPVGGTLSDTGGQFIIRPVPSGTYRIVASFLGYKPATRYIEVTNNQIADAGLLELQDSVITIADAIVIGEKARAKVEGNKTTFLVSRKMADASGTGTDILKLIPGIQVDLMQNIMVEGSRDLVIYVDGKERDKNFVSQLAPGKIDKIEIISVPTADFDGNISKALNIVMKKDGDAGLSGQVYSEIPISRSIIYMFPAFSLNYGFKKLNLYASYKGEIACMDLHESLYREVLHNQDSYVSNQYLRQNNRNHRFSYGFDYFMTDRDVLSFYGYCNPYFMDFVGTAALKVNGLISDSWQTDKDDRFNSTTSLYSLFYKHSFEKPGSELKFEISGNTLRAKSTTVYSNEGSTGSIDSLSSAARPGQKGLSFKSDYSVPFGKNLSIKTGAKVINKTLTDYSSPSYKYTETIAATYGSLAYKKSGYELIGGLRIERSFSSLQGSHTVSFFSFLPDAAFRYKLGSHQNLQVSYNRTIRRPDIYQLNPLISFDDPFTLRKGNPLLTPEVSDKINFEYSIQAGNNFFSSKLIYLEMNDVINNLTSADGSGRFEIQPGNCGIIRRYGLQFSGALKFGILSLNPYLMLFRNSTSVNNFARQSGVESRNQLCLASSISAVLSFRKDFALSSVFQYNTPQNNIQDNYFCDALYFVSFDKTFAKKLKVGIGSGLMFTRSFIYNASDIHTNEFSSCYRGYVTIPSAPLWLKISYQFNSGKIRSKLEREREDVSVKPAKGF
jgi:hypothetical protein